MKYNNIELKEVTEPQIFNPPKKMLVWNSIMDYAMESLVVAIVERSDGLCTICHDCNIYPHSAEIPEESNPKPKPRMVTNRELSKWLVQGNGEMTFKSKSESEIDHLVFSSHLYEEEFADEECDKALKRNDDGSWVVVRKWEDTEWHDPTADYLGLE